MTENVQVENTINSGNSCGGWRWGGGGVGGGENKFCKPNSRELYQVSNCLLYGEYDVLKGWQILILYIYNFQIRQRSYKNAYKVIFLNI